MSERLPVAELLRPRPAIAARADLLHLVDSSEPILRDHFVLQGGRHVEYFLRFSRIGMDRERVEACAQALVETAQFDRERLTVLCPESAGFYLGHAVARQLGCPLAVSRIDLARRPMPSFRQGTIEPNAAVLVVNDVVTTGQSLRPLVQLVKERGARVAGVAAFATQRGARARLTGLARVDTHFLFETRWPIYDADECPLCRLGTTPLPAAELN